MKIMTDYSGVGSGHIFFDTSRTLRVLHAFIDHSAAGGPTVQHDRLSLDVLFGRRAFSVGGPTTWNALPDDLPDPSPSVGDFRRTL